ncbi:MAG: hypothetical protein ACI4SM_03375 [Candidatus Gastranaerophilaceae bacterium]
MNNANKNLRNIVNKYYGDTESIINACSELFDKKIENIDDLKKSVFLVDYDIKKCPIKKEFYPHLFVLIQYFYNFTNITYLSLNDVLKFIHSDEMYDKNVVDLIKKELILARFNGIKIHRKDIEK